MKINILYTIIVLFVLSACSEETVFDSKALYNEYDNKYIYKSYESLPTEVLDKEVDKIETFDLSPGYHQVGVVLDTALFAQGIDNKRNFSYYVPSNLRDNYDIVFELHGNMIRGKKTSDDVLYENPFYTDFYDTTNVIMIKPLGSIKKGTDPMDPYGWYRDAGDLNYIDFILHVFDRKVKEEKGFDMNPCGIFSTGQSSGAIFSWLLTFYRSDVFSAVVPRFGMVKIQPEMLFMNNVEYKVPMRILLGQSDRIVDYETALSHAETWAEFVYKIDGEPSTSLTKYCSRYSANPSKRQYGSVKIKTWQKGQSLLETYALVKAGHGYSGLPADYEKFVYDFFMKNRRQDK